MRSLIVAAVAAVTLLATTAASAQWQLPCGSSPNGSACIYACRLN
jgi:hypothetical protein